MNKFGFELPSSFELLDEDGCQSVAITWYDRGRLMRLAAGALIALGFWSAFIRDAAGIIFGIVFVGVACVLTCAARIERWAFRHDGFRWIQLPWGKNSQNTEDLSDWYWGDFDSFELSQDGIRAHLTQGGHLLFARGAPVEARGQAVTELLTRWEKSDKDHEADLVAARCPGCATLYALEVGVCGCGRRPRRRTWRAAVKARLRDYTLAERCGHSDGRVEVEPWVALVGDAFSQPPRGVTIDQADSRISILVARPEEQSARRHGLRNAFWPVIFGIWFSARYFGDERLWVLFLLILIGGGIVHWLNARRTRFDRIELTPEEWTFKHYGAGRLEINGQLRPTRTTAPASRDIERFVLTDGGVAGVLLDGKKFTAARAVPEEIRSWLLDRLNSALEVAHNLSEP